MKNYVKKITFICSGLFIIVGTFVLYRIEVSASSAPKKFGAWNLNCTVNNEKQQFCFLSQQINNIEKDKEKEILAIYHIGYFNNGEQKSKELKIIEILPPNVQILAGTAINSGGKYIAAGKYVNCTNQGCQAVATVSQSEIDTLLSNDNYVEFLTADGKQAKVSFVKNGLKEGLKALK